MLHVVDNLLKDLSLEFNFEQVNTHKGKIRPEGQKRLMSHLKPARNILIQKQNSLK